MAQVAVDHEQIVIADARHTAAGDGTYMHAARFSEKVVVADLKAGGLAAVLLVLRGGTDDGVGEKFVVLTDDRVPGQGDVVVQAVAVTHGDIGPDHAERADLHAVTDLGLTVNHGQGADDGLLAALSQRRFVMADVVRGVGQNLCRRPIRPGPQNHRQVVEEVGH